MMNIFKTYKFSQSISATLMVALLAFSVGDVRALLSLRFSDVGPKKAHAAGELGKITRTAEFLLGGGLDISTVTSGTTMYASSTGWSTTKPSTVNATQAKIQGANIKVLSAALDVSYELQSAATHSLFENDVFMDVQGSQSAGVDVNAGDVTSRDNTTSGIVGNAIGFTTFNGIHDVSGFFTTQTDVEWNSGVAVIAGIKHTGSVSRDNTNTKLIITYEADIPTVAGQLTKTIHLPLDSTAGTDNGTRQASCPLSTTCAYRFDLSNTPDLTTANLVSAFVELDLTRLTTSAVSPSFTLNANANATGQKLYTFGLPVTTGTVSSQVVMYPLATSTLVVNGANTLNVINGAVPSQALFGLGGEVVLTYAYDATTNNTNQAETVRFATSTFQGVAGSAGTANTPLGSQVLSVINSGATPKSGWMRMRVPVFSSTVFTSTTTTGALVRANSVSLAMGATRSGDTPTLIHDFSADLTANNTNVSAQYKYSVASPQISAEMFMTFVWNGQYANGWTNSISVPASQNRTGPAALAMGPMSRSATIQIGEAGQKTYRSSYVAISEQRGDTAPVATGVITATVSGVTTSITEASGPLKEFTNRVLVMVPAGVFGTGVTFSEKTFAVEITESNSALDTTYFANQVVLTYDAFPVAKSTTERSLHTIEFALGGGTDAVARTSGTLTYAGADWNTAKGTTNTVIIPAINARVVSAYIDVSFLLAAGASINGATTTVDVSDGTTTLTDVRISDLGVNGTGETYNFNSGVTPATDASVGFHREYDATAMFANYPASSLASGLSVRAGFSALTNATSRNLTSAKLVLTYADDEDINHASNQSIVKTVRFPLATKSTSCTVCAMSYNAQLDDWDGTAGSILDAHYEVTETDFGASANTATLSVGGPSSPGYTRSEVFSDIATVKLFWIPAISSSGGFWPNTAQTLTATNTIAQYGVGGEVVVTYKAVPFSLHTTETVVLPLGQVLASSTSLAVGSGSINLPSTGLSVKNVWLRVQDPISSFGTMTVVGKVGGASNISTGYTYGAAADFARGPGVPMVIHDLSTATSSLSGATTIIASSTSSNTNIGAHMNIEAVITYSSDVTNGGVMLHTTEFIATPSCFVTIASKPCSRSINMRLPENMQSLAFTGAMLRMYAAHSAIAAVTNILTPTAYTQRVGGKTQVVNGAGDVETYQPSFQILLSEAQLFRSSILPGPSAVEFTESVNQANIVQQSAVLVLTYSETHDIPRPKYDQSVFGFYVNNDALDPTVAWHPSLGTPLGEQAGIASSTRPVRQSESVRLRMDIGISGHLNPGIQTFQLEFAPLVTSCSAVSVWSAIDLPGGTSLWKGTLGSVTAGTPIGKFLLTRAITGGATSTYEVGGISALNPYAANDGQYLEYDWNIMRNGAPGDTTYCFRMAKGDNTALDTYSGPYPTIATAPYTPETLYWKWYNDATNETPMSIESGSSIANRTMLKLRVGLGDVAGVAGLNERYVLQWSPNADFANYAPIKATSTCVADNVFCYAQGGGVDGQAVSATVLGQGYAVGEHVMSTTTTFSAAANSQTEMEYSIIPMRQMTGQQYYFRLWDVNRGRAISASSTLGGALTLTSEGATAGLTITGTSSNVTIAGNITTATTTATSTPFGLVGGGADSIIAHKLTVSTNAQEGYNLNLSFVTDLMNADGAAFATTTGTNAVPDTWANSCKITATGCLGYHTTAPLLSGGSTRFLANDTWAGPVASAQEEIGYSQYPTTTVQYVVYRAKTNGLTPAGSYNAEIKYILSPVY